MTTVLSRLIMVALCAACFGATARAQRPTSTPPPVQEQVPEGQQNRDAEPVQPKRPPRADEPKKNARPAADANAKPEPFDKATPEQMSKQCVTLATEEGA